MTSRKSEYLEKARAALSLAERVNDEMTKRSLQQAADSWRLLAELEDAKAAPALRPSRLRT